MKQFAAARRPSRVPVVDSGSIRHCDTPRSPSVLNVYMLDMPLDGGPVRDTHSPPASRAVKTFAVALLCGLLVGCAPAPAPTPIPLDQERFFLPSDVAAHAPAGWAIYETKLSIGIPYGGPLFLANQPFPDPCTGSTEQSIQCFSFPPPVRLAPGGVVVGFDYSRQMMDVAFPEPSGSGDVITLNGFRTKVVRDTPGVCGSAGADETVTIVIPSLADWTGRTTIEACLRGPNLGTNEAKLLQMVETAIAR